jgi:2'-5' RNA ligase
VAGDDRLRLFCALRLPEETVDALVRWQQRELRDDLDGGRREAGEGDAGSREVAIRLVPPPNLHVTLAFLGPQPAGELPAIVAALRAAAGEAGAIRLRVRGYRETRSVGMLTFDDEGRRAVAVAERLHGLLEEAGVYRREARPWLPHLTVLRFRERPRLDPPLPDLGEVSPSDAAVYISRLRSSGAQYEVLETAELGCGRGP